MRKVILTTVVAATTTPVMATDFSEWAVFGWGVPACPHVVSAAMSQAAIEQRQQWADASVTMLNNMALALVGKQAVTTHEDMDKFIRNFVVTCMNNPDYGTAAATTSVYITMLEEKYPGVGVELQRKLLEGCP